MQGPPAPARYAVAPAAGGRAAPWAPLIDGIIATRYPDAQSPAAQALRLAWTHSLAASTYRTYGSKLRKFLDFCAASGCCAIPTTATTLELYIGFLLSEGRVRAEFFPQYISAIRAVHRDLLLPHPDSPVLTLLLRGAKHLQRARRCARRAGPCQPRLPCQPLPSPPHPPPRQLYAPAWPWDWGLPA